MVARSQNGLVASRVVVPFLESIMGGPAAWERNETVRRAIEIRDGVVRIEKVLHFQKRATECPHAAGR